MAAIDYGAVVWKNGERYCGDTNYPALVEIGARPIKCQIIDLDKKVIFSPKDGKKSYRFEYLGCEWHVKEICPCVYRATVKKGKDLYQIVFGYGIDASKLFWNKYKLNYLSKSRAKQVDKVLNELGF